MTKVETRVTCCVALLDVFATSAVPAETGPLENLALGKPYTVSPAPDYGHCADAGAATQLTDGHHTTGRLWMHKAAVDWSGRTTKLITIDLGACQPIAGVPFTLTDAPMYLLLGE